MNPTMQYLQEGHYGHENRDKEKKSQMLEGISHANADRRTAANFTRDEKIHCIEETNQEES